MTLQCLCPSCGNNQLSTLYNLQNVPVSSCVLLPSKQEALDFPRGTISLVFCENCGFIFNSSFESSKVDYSSVYEDQQCFSSTFNVFSKNLAVSLISKHGLHGKKIFEIGCGKGDFLALLCELGENSGVGVDPAYVEGRVQGEVLHRLTFFKDYFSKKYSEYIGDFVCCRHTLEHISNTSEFIVEVRASIGKKMNTVVFFEIPDVLRVLTEHAFWDIYYEHCSYFTPGSLSRLFRNSGFEVTDLYKGFNDQYLFVEAKPANGDPILLHELEETVQEEAKYVKNFVNQYNQTLSHWRNLLRQSNAENKRIVVWGSGSKCVAFMSTLGITDEIEYVIDINPYRHGLFIPGSGKKIMAPEFLKKYRPDLVIVMNPIYFNEIKSQLNEMNVITDVLCV